MRTIKVPSHFKITQEQYNNLVGKDLVTIECLHCLKEYTKSKRDINRQILDKEEPVKYCSKSCSDKSQITSITKACSACGKEVTRAQSEIKKAKTDNIFCNRSCSATYNNKITKLKHGLNIVKEYECSQCNKVFKSDDGIINKHTTCSTVCWQEAEMKTKTIKDTIRIGTNRYNLIRQNARSYSKYIYPRHCMLCSYDKHIEVCHVKDIKDFDVNLSMYEVNNKYNLIHLCPNCHWEFDHDLINISIITEAQNKILNSKECLS